MTSDRNLFGLGDGRVRDNGRNLSHDDNCINTLNNKTKCGFKDRRDLPDISLIMVMVIVGKVGRRVRFNVGNRLAPRSTGLDAICVLKYR